jgi:hypothetical protein
MNDPTSASAQGISDHHRRGRQLLSDQTRAIDALIHDLLPLDPNTDRSEIRVPLLMMQAAGTSVHSVLALTQERNMAIRDCFAITRSAVETAINAAFIAVSGTDMAERAIRHMRQKRWRDLHREGSAGPLQVRIVRDIGFGVDAFPGLREALDEFTDNQGRERPFWTRSSIEKRIEIVTRSQRRAGLCLGIAAFAIYRPASELIHGSYYGVNLFWQGSREVPATNQAEFEQLWMGEHFVTLLSSLFFAISGAIEAIASTHELPAHGERQELLSKNLATLIEDMSPDEGALGHDFQACPVLDHACATYPKGFVV